MTPRKGASLLNFLVFKQALFKICKLLLLICAKLWQVLCVLINKGQSPVFAPVFAFVCAALFFAPAAK